MNRVYSRIEHKTGRIHAVLWVNRFPIGIALAIRIGLSTWLAVIWAIVDPYRPIFDDIMSKVFGHLTPSPTILGRALIDVWLRWDAIHFMNIAKVTYFELGKGDLNYFPLYPYMTRLLSINNTIDITVLGLLISTVASVFAFVIFYNLVLTAFNNENLAKWSVLIWAIYPTSFFLFAPYSDALFSVFTLGCLFMLYKEKWIFSGVLASFAGLTRAQGILLIIPIASSLLINRRNNSNKILKIVGATIMAAVGSASYLLWRSQITDHLFSGYATFSRRSIVNPFVAVIHVINQAFTTRSPYVFADVLSIVFFGLVIAYMLYTKIFRDQVVLLIYTIITFAAFIPWYSDVVSSYQSATRYVISLYPAFIAIAYILINARPTLRFLYTALSIAGFMVASALFALWIFVG